MLEDLADEIVRMEDEARDWRDRDRDEPSSGTLSLEWPEFDELARDLAHRIRSRGLHVDAVVAIARGGLALGLRLAHLLHVRRFGTVTAWKCPSVPAAGEPGPPWKTRFEAIGLPAGEPPRLVLIVDDTLGRGRTLSRAKQLVQAHYASDPPKVVFAALYRITRNVDEDLPDELVHDLFVARQLKGRHPKKPWLQLPWEQPDPALNGS
jgi:hypoxanthine phosphoribosyltransferase